MKANQINPFLHTVKRGGWYAHVIGGPVVRIRLDPPTRRNPDREYFWVQELAHGKINYYPRGIGMSPAAEGVVAQHGQRAAKAALRWLEENYHRIIAERERGNA